MNIVSQPSLDADEALDILSGGFETPTAAPVVKAAVPPSAPSAQVRLHLYFYRLNNIINSIQMIVQRL